MTPGCQAQGDVLVLRTAEAGNLLFCILNSAQDFARPFIEHTACLGRGHAARMADEKGDAEVLLEGADLQP